MLKHKTDNAFHCRPEWFISKNAIIGDAVITTNNERRVTSLKPVAQFLTGWTQADSVNLWFVVVRKYRSPKAVTFYGATHAYHDENENFASFGG